jgi:hypothetical protein
LVHAYIPLTTLPHPNHSYVPYTEEKAGITSCGIPVNYNASKEWANKKVVLFAVPGQFSGSFIPSFLRSCAPHSFCPSTATTPNLRKADKLSMLS